jgi:hypothetical protein
VTHDEALQSVVTYWFARADESLASARDKLRAGRLAFDSVEVSWVVDQCAGLVRALAGLARLGEGEPKP